MRKRIKTLPEIAFLSKDHKKESTFLEKMVVAGEKKPAKGGKTAVEM